MRSRLFAVILLGTLAVACSKKADTDGNSASGDDSARPADPAASATRAQAENHAPPPAAQASAVAANPEAPADPPEAMTKTAVYVAKFHHDS